MVSEMKELYMSETMAKYILDYCIVSCWSNKELLSKLLSDTMENMVKHDILSLNECGFSDEDIDKLYGEKSNVKGNFEIKISKEEEWYIKE